ncbi:helix-hairpin-helix domain-containing protein [Kaistella flava (ex Peng et al. 2021)]|uniref:Helix-hairpin-helix domain-containing protein n=1 Tax=Kaistella flava (ex Peng et al. 2021) TaxID=2038776 RepID=A0A7M2Y8G5_9FLAO|nr:helix-hairpin-helix domain-containing protein [Kaistella flava (ex Peng et al. 2021)]QOW09964.1 helix-hairpin-helix domain-containing protein [Kaistella flava (ex Peng et al. 2021)]
MRFTVPLSAAKNYFLGFVTSGIFLVSGLYFFSAEENQDNAPISFSENLEGGNLTSKKVHLSEFNPNDLNEEQWIHLGFSERQVATILKYKSVVGGSFNSKEQLKKCYAISEEKYNELAPYFVLPNSPKKSTSFQNFSNYTPRKSSNQYSNNYNKGLSIPGKFNPDSYSITDFINLGFTEKQAVSILKYKNYLGGSFISKEKFKECYIINEENYRKLAPYLLLPESSSENKFDKKSFASNAPLSEKPTITYSPFNPNTTNLEGWKNLGFSEKQAQVIINYRDKNLKGSFKSLEDIARCFVISAEKFEQIKPYIILNSENTNSKSSDHSPVNSNNSQQNQSVKSNNNAETKTDFKKTDLNEITFKQLIEFGFDEKSAASLIGFRNKLGGFVNTKQIIDTYNIDKDLAETLISTAFLFTENVPKYTLMDAPESWLKNHPYFKYYADKIIYYRITFSNEKKFFRTMNIKPEAEQKMRLYLK